MNFSFLRRTGLLSIIGATLLWSASCVNIDEQLGKNLIPTDRLWEVYTPDAAPLNTGEVMLMTADSLSGYSSRRFTFGAISDGVLGTSVKSTSFTLVPISDTLDFGKNTVVKQFHFCAVKDTLSTVYDNQRRMLQNGGQRHDADDADDDNDGVLTKMLRYLVKITLSNDCFHIFYR